MAALQQNTQRKNRGQAKIKALFVYDGWNLIRELNEAGVAQKDYVWGLDLSQSLQGAGGILIRGRIFKLDKSD
jgi:hypothetical protein